MGLITSFTGGVASTNRTTTLQSGVYTVSTGLFSNGGERLALNPNGGNVGIGTDSPVTSLHVNGDITVPTNSYVKFATDGQESINGDGSTLYFRTQASNTFFLSSTLFAGYTTTAGGIANEAVSSTNPTLIPNRQDTNTGIG